MSFEAQFPTMDIIKHPEAYFITQDKALMPYLMKHCLDKAKVKELFDKYNMHIHHPIFYKELGL